MSELNEGKKLLAEGTGAYGSRHWCIKTSASDDGEIYVHADFPQIMPDGTLTMIGGFRRYLGDKPEEQCPILIIAAGQWTVVYAASVIDGSAVAVEHWKGEVAR